MAAGLWTVLQTEVYIELSCGIRCREGVKEYEEKIGNITMKEILF